MILWFILLLASWDASAVIFPSIPAHLLPCYRNDGPILSAPYRIDVLISSLRTLEINSMLDLRLFTSSLLRSVRLDGIERGENAVETEFVTPYHGSGFQFHKYKLLMDMFLPNQDLSLLSDMKAIFSAGEICMLHKMLSSTVNSWERGDENFVCPEVPIQRFSVFNTSSTRTNSRCPIEQGVIQTDWGTISPGSVIAGIAASMESQRVLVTDILNADLFRSGLAEPMETADNFEEINIETVNIDTVRETPRMANADISNVWVATLAGDLAEVAVNQGPRIGLASHRVILGGMNRWNDTILPRHYFMLNHTNGSMNWHLTDAEILGGIDGLILAHHLPNWIEQRGTLRVSQLLDMYYSNEGISFDPTIKACNRLAMFKKILDIGDLITEVSNFAQVLSLRQGSVFIPVAEMDNICKSVVMAFLEYYPPLLERYNKDCNIDNDVPTMELVVATDGSWTGYNVEQFMSWLGSAGEVGSSGSTISLMHGNVAGWIASPSNNLTAFFEHVRNFTDNWPTRLNFPNILSFLMRHLENRTLEDAVNQVSVSPSIVVLIVSPSDRLSETESERANDLMKTLRTTHFDVYFNYVAQDLTGFKNINNDYYDYSEFFLQVPSTTVQNAIKMVNEQIITNQVPKSIVGAHCSVNGTIFTQVPYEDFVVPNRMNKYRIHPYYLQEQPLINVQIRNSGQGSLLVCSWRGSDSSHNCHTVAARQMHAVNFTTPCASPNFCPPAHISVTGVETTNTCANNDCRYPHSIGYYIEHSGLRCLQLRSFSPYTAPFLRIYLFLLLIISIL